MSRRKRITQKDVCEGLRRLAFGEITDAVTLLFESEENILATLSSLDLFNVNEIKRSKGGGMEIKFFDRLKALEKLREVVEFENESGSVSFYEALEKSSAMIKHENGAEEYE
ncbi:MAG: terminase small subunit [Acetobacter sp.]|nr:terminase small subunit [Bacteroides sp.]MCM1341719.1 terminase small subunit [Acetobacter sp.]MCM1432342.1 terminase small subunit [Clostridiales bacterium]